MKLNRKPPLARVPSLTRRPAVQNVSNPHVQRLVSSGNNRDVPPAVSFEVSEPGPRLMSPPSTPGISSPLSSSSNCRQTSVDLKTSGLKSREQSQASLPEIMRTLYRITSSSSLSNFMQFGGEKKTTTIEKLAQSSTTRRLKCDKRSTSLTTSRNSSVNSLLLLGFDDADAFRSDQDPDSNLARRIKGSDIRLMAKKRQEIIQIQRLLTHQQKIYIGLYAQIKDLEARAGLDPGDCLGEIRILTMKGWAPHDLLLLVMDHPASKQADRSGALGSALLDELTYELSSITKEILTMGADLTARRTRLLEYFRRRIPELKVKNEFDTETEIIHKMVFETAKQLDTKISRSLDIAKTSWKDRELLLKKIDRLNKELSIFQSKMKPSIEEEDVGKPNNDENKKNDSRSATELQELREKLNKERAARESMKHTVATAEGMLRTARARITVLERDLKQALKQVDTTVRKHKEYETLVKKHRCRETSYDVRSRKLLQESKTGEGTIEMLSIQRDALELRVKELQDQLKLAIEDYERRESEHQTCLDDLQEKVDEQERLKKMAEARGMELEKRIKDIQDQYRQLHEQSEALVKISNEKCLDFLPHKENEPSKRETELWKDLQFTKKTLARVEDELKQSREDKEGLLNSLAKIAQEGSENNMANELLLREQKNFQLKQVIETLKENLKSMKETLAQKDNQVIALKLESTCRNYECCSKDTPKQELALDVIELSTQVTNLTRERESLITEAMTRALMLERYERCAKLFAQVTRTRREIAAQLDNSRAERERPRSEGAFRDANLSSSLSSSCLKAAKTWEELRTDREHVQQLQEVVASQNLQLQRECRIRNQLEQRRAILERLFLNRASPDQYVPAENLAAYFGTSSYFVNDAFMNAS